MKELKVIIFCMLCWGSTYIVPVQAQPEAFFDEGIKLDTVNYGNGSVYIGGVRDRKLHGKGILFSPFGDTLYMGKFQFGRKEGQGKYFFKNGNIYTGEWQANHMHGNGKNGFPEWRYL